MGKKKTDIHFTNVAERGCSSHDQTDNHVGWWNRPTRPTWCSMSNGSRAARSDLATGWSLAQFGSKAAAPSHSPAPAPPLLTYMGRCPAKTIQGVLARSTPARSSLTNAYWHQKESAGMDTGVVQRPAAVAHFADGRTPLEERTPQR